MEEAEARLRSIITSLYLVMAQAHEYHGPQTQKAITNEMYASGRLVHPVVPSDGAPL